MIGVERASASMDQDGGLHLFTFQVGCMVDCVDSDALGLNLQL